MRLEAHSCSPKLAETRFFVRIIDFQSFSASEVLVAIFSVSFSSFSVFQIACILRSCFHCFPPRFVQKLNLFWDTVT